MYKSTIDTWYKLSDCPARDVFAIVMIHGELTAVSVAVHSDWTGALVTKI